MNMVMIIMSSRLKIKNSTLSLFYDLSLELWLMPPKSTLYMLNANKLGYPHNVIDLTS